jgi:hypothetical protein
MKRTACSAETFLPEADVSVRRPADPSPSYDPLIVVLPTTKFRFTREPDTGRKATP